MASFPTLQFLCLSHQHSIWSSTHRKSSNESKFRTEFGFNWSRLSKTESRVVKCSVSSDVNPQDVGKNERDVLMRNMKASVGKFQAMISSKDPVAKFQGIVSSLPPVVYVMKKHAGSNFVVAVWVAIAFVVVAVKAYAARKVRYSHPGSVADLVRRGQLRSDRRGISKPLKYEDPFNNPMVKVGKGNSTVEMCGKVYRLAPVTLTEEQQAMHQKRRSRAYQWKRPTIFLKEGDSIPSDVDPDTVRWIPANHPFATTASDIDEDLAQNNVYQKRGVPFRIQAEHEALQRKLEALQNDQKFNKVVIDSGNAKDFERPFKSNSKLYDHTEQSTSNNHTGSSLSFKSEDLPNSSESKTSSEDMQKP